jgi:hypothetical protein
MIEPVDVDALRIDRQPPGVGGQHGRMRAKEVPDIRGQARCIRVSPGRNVGGGHRDPCRRHSHLDQLPPPLLAYGDPPDSRVSDQPSAHPSFQPGSGLPHPASHLLIVEGHDDLLAAQEHRERSRRPVPAIVKMHDARVAAPPVLRNPAMPRELDGSRDDMILEVRCGQRLAVDPRRDVLSGKPPV